ncbi:MAG: bifunctional 5,10-methylenetetrahydrofolate dehydrogenase/5,10-methenyltetrahydrofolate cyclohydrolase [Candidatus Komeilibacteria bacterium]
MSKIIDGKKLADTIIESVGNTIKKENLRIGLAVLLIGDNAASKLYVKLKGRACHKVGIDFHVYRFPGDSSQTEIIEAIQWLNQDNEIQAILVQLPLPKHLDETAIIQAIDPKKDVDGFHPDNIKSYLAGESDFLPGLTRGIQLLLADTKENLATKQICILANSDEFAEGLEKFFHNQKLQATHTHLSEPDWQTKTKKADVLIVAVGQPWLITADNIKKDVIIIDVGTNRLPGKKIVGDVDYDDVVDKCSYITPVPGGVGPMTIAMLLQNCVYLTQRLLNKNS